MLIVRDGWGHNPNPHGNAVHLAKTPVADQFARNYANTLIRTDGPFVGLPESTMGNSEVGHQNIGAGRVVYQESVRITQAISNGEFFANPALTAVVRHAATNGTALHLMGLASDAGVHARLSHLLACIDLAQKHGVKETFIHAFTDGRDTPPDSGLGYVEQIEEYCTAIGCGQIATVCGRYWAMDRDNRWDRVQRAYQAIVHGQGETAANARAAVQQYYDDPAGPSLRGDEFISPTVITGEGGRGARGIDDGDVVIFYNYRGDRPREITRALVDIDFNEFDRGSRRDIRMVTMTAYAPDLKVDVAFPKLPAMKSIFGELIANHNLRQFRCAETEKFAHVTYFFNDYRESPFPGEDRQIIASPKVATYDLQPEMSALEVTREVLRRVGADYDAIILNYANGDMVGHTGVLEAAIKAIETVDHCVGQVTDAWLDMGGVAIVTADHGNSEMMIDPNSGRPHTAHTLYPVPLYVLDERFKGIPMRDDGCLADVAPTALKMMGLEIPPEMTGESLFIAAVDE